jgi:hypothetical protein
VIFLLEILFDSFLRDGGVVGVGGDGGDSGRMP